MSEKKTIKEKINELIADYKREATNLDEAKRKRKAQTIVEASIFGGIALLFCLFSIFLGIFVLILAAAIVGVSWYQRVKKESRNFCDKCGEKIDYKNNVSWEVYGVEEKNYQNGNANGKTITKKKTAKLKITCYCTKCETAKIFNQNFDVCIWYSDGSMKEGDLNLIVKNYFKV